MDRSGRTDTCPPTEPWNSCRETSLSLAVVLTADEPHELDEAFAVHLSNPVHGAILKAIGQCTITEVVISGIRLTPW